MSRRFAVLLVTLLCCSKREAVAPPPTPAPKPSILLVTLDTTRADAIGEATPSFNALAARGRNFRYAYATVPQTLPSHASMMTGLYPAGHGVRENGRFLSSHTVVAERLRSHGYRTAAFVSAFAVAKRFGLARGFEVYDEDFGQEAERDARSTTERALAYLGKAAIEPLFVWVHYYDPHHPYSPPEPHRTRFANRPYLGEVAAMDEQLGRLVQAFEKRGPLAIIIAADHGEGLGEHGEEQHGNLLYQSTMHVPMLLVGPGIAPGVIEAPASTRRIYHTILDWAGIDPTDSLRGASSEQVILGESMIPFLHFGWQPQIMAVDGRQKVIHAGAVEVYDVIADPKEQRDLGDRASVTRAARKALAEYPLASADTVQTTLDDESRKQLAALGYITADSKPVVRKDAPRPRDMAHLFDDLERASDLFVREQYAAVISLFEKILEADSHNLMAALRLAVAHSNLGHDDRALDAFERAESIAPDSPDVRNYLALHYARTGDWQNAAPLLERVVAESPDRLPALEALAMLRERQNRPADALQLRQKIRTMKALTGAELARIGELAMALGKTEVALEAFESARDLPGFRHDLELGILYLATRRYGDARSALDRVPRSHPSYPMALFKRAQVSVLLGENDRAARIAAARKQADETTRELIARERLFQ